MNHPSSGFVASLEMLDPLLSVRWGEFCSQWVIERKAFVPSDEVMYLQRRFIRLQQWVRDDSRPDHQREIDTFKGVAEEYESARAGRRVVVFVKNLNRETYDAICASDMTRYGGYSRLADELDKRDAALREARDKAAETLREDMNREAHDVLDFLWRKKDTLLAHGEKDLNVLLHGRKRAKPAIEIVSA